MKQNLIHFKKVFLISILLSYYTLQIKGQTSTPPPAPVKASVDKNILCGPLAPPTTITLSAEGIVGQVVWYKNGCSHEDGGIKIGEGNNLQIETNSAAIYYAKNYENGLYSLSCASVEVKILQTTPSVIQHDLCSSSEITLTAYEALAYVWSTGGTVAPSILGTTRSITVGTPGVYSVTLFADGCSYTLTHEVYNSAPVIHTEFVNQPHCPNELGSIGFEYANSVGEVSYSLDGGITFSPTVPLADGNIGIPNLLPGEYWIILKNESTGCTSIPYQYNIHIERLSYGEPNITFDQETDFPDPGNCFISKEKMRFSLLVRPRVNECDGYIINIDPLPDFFPIGTTVINYTIENVWGEVFPEQMIFVVQANVEVCNGLDDDCDGEIDEGFTTTYYRDKDGDGYGISNDTKLQCQQPPGYASRSGDCNDNNTGINPGTVWAKDADNDGYGDGTIIIQCQQPTGFKAAACLIATHGDCNDNNAAIHPGATEICGNGINDDCDDSTSDICPVADNDNDGDPDVNDCDDNNPNIHHEAIEVCNGIDDNCNGLIDENTSINAAITPTGTQNLCSGKTLTLVASPVLAGNTFVWYKNNRVIDNQTSPTLVVNSAGDYKVKITQANCSAISAVTTISLIASPSASIKISGKNSNPCNGSVQLVANSTQGTYNWYKDGVPQNSTATSFTATMAGEYWIVITKNGCSTESNHITLSCPSTRLKSSETMNEITNVKRDLQIHPNPATHFLDVQWTTRNTLQSTIRILNSEGRLVKTLTTKGAVNKQRISLDGLANGIYMLVLKTGADIQVSKFVIQ